MQEDKRKHLEFIQGIINRHNSNSFTIKGWTIGIISALFALASSLNEPLIIFISIIPILLFWGLDSFYLANERCFVDLYNAVVKENYEIPKTSILKSKKDTSGIAFETGNFGNFEMNFSKFKKWKDNQWWYVLFSKSIIGIYLPMIIVTLILGCISIKFNKNQITTCTVSGFIQTDKSIMKDSIHKSVVSDTIKFQLIIPK